MNIVRCDTQQSSRHQFQHGLNYMHPLESYQTVSPGQTVSPDNGPLHLTTDHVSQAVTKSLDVARTQIPESIPAIEASQVVEAPGEEYHGCDKEFKEHGTIEQSKNFSLLSQIHESCVRPGELSPFLQQELMCRTLRQIRVIQHDVPRPEKSGNEEVCKINPCQTGGDMIGSLIDIGFEHAHVFPF
eukprot:GHVP01004111.1.p1 GENE.GHVP01004111.1~~GHVP01004111.1.p1  ORF type:complete len:186 (-),score=13.44 GHVP01004111.1:47-604(-)